MRVGGNELQGVCVCGAKEGGAACMVHWLLWTRVPCHVACACAYVCVCVMCACAMHTLLRRRARSCCVGTDTATPPPSLQALGIALKLTWQGDNQLAQLETYMCLAVGVQAECSHCVAGCCSHARRAVRGRAPTAMLCCHHARVRAIC